MLKSLKFRAILVLIFLVIFAVFLVPNFVELKGTWKRFLPSDKIRLGLDLKGGMHLLLAMDTSKMMENLTDRKFNGLKDGMIRDGVRFLNLERKGDVISVAIKADQKDKLYNILGKEYPDLKVAGSRNEGDVLTLDLSIVEKEVCSSKEMRSIKPLRRSAIE